ncbi:uncharacterized protein J8A68_001791 [[Candida] subhashii]|uniref:D-xylose 1-dehydrogenase (NADP(+), D-xylono-1,5-lactone-forming) n=1 Tax=[Candida] subhashii TaxID=561895 RepID=A0A8J5QF84_9ASCO|nr:uncharacterized protein J8A68_001791 [[Candida] subhashii]KAG7664694.1 hypothetical protein J8A68_001791 [[Candida] subhashii]
MTITINWGILGAGNISAQFVHDLLLNNSRQTEIRHIVKSIGCSSKEKGENFIQSVKLIPETNNYGISPKVETYSQLYANPEVNIVYIGTPHNFHKNQAIDCLNNNKHVLCEKPLTVNKKEAIELINLAKSKNLFFMEAMWTRFFPAITKLREKVYQEKVIGDIHRLFADLSYNSDITNVPITHRIRDKNLAAGSLLDIGIYPITYSRILLDDKVGQNHSKFDYKSFLTLDPTDGIDHLCSIIVKYENGTHGLLTCSEFIDGPKAYVRLEGTKGWVEMYSDNPARAKHFKIFNKAGEEIFEYKDESGYNGFIYEANACAIDIQSGKIENDIMPHDETLLVMDIMDQIRKDNGLVYDQDL